MFHDALVEDLVDATPCVLKRNELPKKIDKDPEWRAAATYTRQEIERLISEPTIPADRHLLYALKALAGLRHGEAASLRWRHYEPSLEPLGRLLIATSLHAKSGKEKDTKTGVPRRVPVHPVLAKLLAAWKAGGWEALYGRRPTPEDVVVPTRNLTMRQPPESQEALVGDLERLGLRVQAGGNRNRGGHDMRSWFISTCQENGAHRDLLRVITHTAPSDVMGGYTRVCWPALCAEVAKLRIKLLDGAVPKFGTAFGTVPGGTRITSEKRATPAGFERVEDVATNSVTVEHPKVERVIRSGLAAPRKVSW
jgi:integrase